MNKRRSANDETQAMQMTSSTISLGNIRKIWLPEILETLSVQPEEEKKPDPPNAANNSNVNQNSDQPKGNNANTSLDRSAEG